MAAPPPHGPRTVKVTKQAGTVGHIRDYTMVVLGDTVAVFRGNDEITTEVVEGRGWAETADFEILYLYDKADSGFGYAVNLADSGLSEWGYAPFAT